MEGTIPNLRPTILNFPPPLKYNVERKNVENDETSEKE